MGFLVPCGSNIHSRAMAARDATLQTVLPYGELDSTHSGDPVPMLTATLIWQESQQPAPTPPTPPAPPVPTPQAGEVTVTLNDAPLMAGVPQTGQQVQAMRARRSELSNQLTSATSRRDRLVRDLEKLPAEQREGVQQRIQLLDQRILRLETEIAETGSLLAASSAIAAPDARPPSDGPPVAFVLSILMIVFVAFPLAIAWARRILRKPLPAPPPSPLLTESAERLERLEHAVDAIAIEVERISEGQRFVTKALGSKNAV